MQPRATSSAVRWVGGGEEVLAAEAFLVGDLRQVRLGGEPPIQLSGNTVLLEGWKRLEDQMRVVLLSSGRTEPLEIMSHAHRGAIVDAIDEGDLDKASRLIYAHMDLAAAHWSSDRRAEAS